MLANVPMDLTAGSPDPVVPPIARPYLNSIEDRKKSLKTSSHSENLPITFIYVRISRTSRMELKKDEVVVLVPAYNEELTISMVVMLAKEHSSHVIVIDDGSQDRTRYLAELAGAEVLSHSVNKRVS